MGKNGLPPNSEAGYWYDWQRQRRSKDEAEKEKHSKLKKKMDKLSKKNKVIKRKT